MEAREYSQKIRKVTSLVRRVMPNLPYHNLGHALDVYRAVNRLAELEGVDQYKRFLAGTAGILHDISLDEEKAAEIAGMHLPRIGYNNQEIREIQEDILATKMPQRPKTLLQKIICDADLDNLGREDFFDKGELLRQEWGLSKNRQWYERQKSFLESHVYHTDSAKALRNAGKQANLKKLNRILQEETCM